MVDSDRKWAISCYIPVLNVIMCPLAAIRKVKSQFCLFHARQGLLLFALWFITIMVALISQTLSLMLWGVVLLLHGVGLFFAITNKMTKIPFIGQFAEQIPPYYIFTLLTGKTPEESEMTNPETKKENSVEKSEEKQ